MTTGKHLLQFTQHRFLYDPKHPSQVRPDPDIFAMHNCKVRMIKANTVYQDYIRDRNHLHMNSTIWATLSNFVEYLIRTNKVEAERDKEGRWCITWIDPEEVKRKAEYEAQEKVKLTEAEKEAKHLAKLVSMRY